MRFGHVCVLDEESWRGFTFQILDEFTAFPVFVTIDTCTVLCIGNWVYAVNTPEFRKFVEKDPSFGVLHWELWSFIDIMSM